MKSIYIAPLFLVLTPTFIRHGSHSFTYKLHHACLGLHSVSYSLLEAWPLDPSRLIARSGHHLHAASRYPCHALQPDAALQQRACATAAE